MGEIVALPFGLMLSYSAIVLVAGTTLGIIVARQFRHPLRPQVALPDHLEHRLAVLEEEMDSARALVDELVDAGFLEAAVRRGRHLTLYSCRDAS